MCIRDRRYFIEWFAKRRAWNIEQKRKREAGPHIAHATEMHYEELENAFRSALPKLHLSRRTGATVLYRPPMDLKWKVTGGRWVCDTKEYVYPDNDWTQFAPDLEIVEVPGDHNSIVLEPNVRVLASHMAKSIAAAERGLAPESVKIIPPLATAAE